MTGLLMSGLRIELKLDDIAGLRNVARHYQPSRPSGGPKSISS